MYTRYSGRLDKYIYQLLAEIKAARPIQGFASNIVDKPSPVGVKRHLLELILSGKFRPFQPRLNYKSEKRGKVFEREFESVPTFKPIRKIQDYQNEFRKPFKCEKQAGFSFALSPGRWKTTCCGGRCMCLRIAPLQSADVRSRAFMGDVHPQIQMKLTEDILALNDATFQLTFKVPDSERQPRHQ